MYSLIVRVILIIFQYFLPAFGQVIDFESIKSFYDEFIKPFFISLRFLNYLIDKVSCGRSKLSIIIDESEDI